METFIKYLLPTGSIILLLISILIISISFVNGFTYHILYIPFWIAIGIFGLKTYKDSRQ